MRVKRVEKDQTRVEVVLWRDLDDLASEHRVADDDDLVLERPDLDAAPRYLFDDADPAVALDIYDIADLERLVGLQGNSGEEVPERVLQRETDNDSEDRGTRKERRQFDVRILRLKDDEERDDRDDDRDHRPYERGNLVLRGVSQDQAENNKIRVADQDDDQRHPEDDLEDVKKAYDDHADRMPDLRRHSGAGAVGGHREVVRKIKTGRFVARDQQQEDCDDPQIEDQKEAFSAEFGIRHNRCPRPFTIRGCSILGSVKTYQRSS